MKKFKLSFLLSVCFLLFSTSSLMAQDVERVLNFHSDIRIDTTRRIYITESVKVNVTGESIKRGIVRTIPLYRKDIYNIDRRIDIRIDSILRNDVKENFTTKIENNDFAIYIGKESETLSPGIYTYTISYSSRGHLGFYNDYDEIYWNVNGNAWNFKIDSISANVYLPQGAKVITNACYTGQNKSTNTDCIYKSVGDTIVQFYGTTSLSPGEGLTIATSFTPHIVNRPAPLSPFQSFLLNDGLQYMLAVGALIYALFLILYWLKTNTFSKQVIIPSFNPPGNKSAGALRYIYKRKMDKKALTATLISMITKKAVVVKNQNSSYTLTPLADTSNLTEDEKELYHQIFATEKTFFLDTNTILGQILQTKINLYNYYIDKEKYNLTSTMVCLALLVVWNLIAFYSLGIQVHNLFLATMPPALILTTYLARKNKFVFIILLLFSLVFFILQLSLFNENFYYKYTSIFSWILVVLDLLYMTTIDPKTKEGDQFISELGGFKKYLSVAEENKLNFFNPSNDNLDQFEKLLPYAIALDCEIQWVDKFSKKINQINYTPSWYTGQSVTTNDDLIKNIIYALKKSRFNLERLPQSKRRNSTTNTFYTNNKSSNNGGSGLGRSSGSSNNSSSAGRGSWRSGSRGGGSSGGGGGGGGGRGW